MLMMYEKVGVFLLQGSSISAVLAKSRAEVLVLTRREFVTTAMQFWISPPLLRHIALAVIVSIPKGSTSYLIDYVERLLCSSRDEEFVPTIWIFFSLAHFVTPSYVCVRAL